MSSKWKGPQKSSVGFPSDLTGWSWLTRMPGQGNGAAMAGLRLELSRRWPTGHIFQPLSECFLRLPHLRLRGTC